MDQRRKLKADEEHEVEKDEDDDKIESEKKKIKRDLLKARDYRVNIKYKIFESYFN